MAHVVVVAALSVLLVVLAVQPVEDANIGAGIALLALLPFGVPWSLVALLPVSVPSVADVVAGAWVNVGLHAWLRRRAARRREAVGSGGAAG